MAFVDNGQTYPERQPILKKEIKIKGEPGYNYDTGDDSNPPHPLAPPLPVISAPLTMCVKGGRSRANGGGVEVKEEAYCYDTEDDTSFLASSPLALTNPRIVNKKKCKTAVDISLKKYW